MNVSGATRNPPTVEFPNLDGVRTMAFALVFLDHAFFWPVHAALSSHPLAQRFAAFALFSGRSGVSLFFVLSGFLITWLLLTEEASTGRVNVPAFYARRCLRVWPLYFAVVAWGVLLYPAARLLLGFSPAAPIGDRWRYFLFLSNFDRLAGQRPLSVDLLWSIAVEEQFYAVWPLVLRFTRGRARPALLVAILGGSIVFRSMHADDPRLLTFHTVSVMGDIALGALGAWLSFQGPGVLRRFTTPRAVAWLLAAFVVMATQAPTWLSRSLLATAFCGFVLEQSFRPGSDLRLGRFPALLRCGRYTYGLYLLHPIAIQILNAATMPMEWFRSPGGGVTRGFLALGVSAFLSIASYHYFETPFLRLKERFAVVHRRSAPPA